MDTGYAMIIKTNSYHQTEFVRKLREVIKATGNDVVLVPHGISDLFITAERNGELVVILNQSDTEGKTELDVVKGFDYVSECWGYARIVMSEAGLSDNSCDTDVQQ
jgi:hypothetical protein